MLVVAYLGCGFYYKGDGDDDTDDSTLAPGPDFKYSFFLPSPPPIC